MKNIVLIITTFVASVTTTEAQKLVIGAKMPDLKGVQWLTSPPERAKATYIDFYQSTNTSCIKNLQKIKELKESNPNLIVVLLTRENNDAIKALANDLGAGYHVGYDSDGKKYEAFGVKFLPFSMVFNSKGVLVWQGNVSQFSGDMLKTFN